MNLSEMVFEFTEFLEISTISRVTEILPNRNVFPQHELKPIEGPRPLMSHDQTTTNPNDHF